MYKVNMNIYISFSGLIQGTRYRVMDKTSEISDMFVTYTISPQPIKLSF